MVNIRELKFLQELRGHGALERHCYARITRGTLFYACKFLGGPADVEPDKWVQIKVTASDCAAIDSSLLHAFPGLRILRES